MELTGVFLMMIFGEWCFVAVDWVASSLNNHYYLQKFFSATSGGRNPGDTG